MDGLEYVRTGEGERAIVLLSGAGMDVDSSSKVYPMAATISTVVASNRLGTGGSDKPTAPQPGVVIVATKSGHFPQIDEPEVVIETIREVIDGYRSAM